MSWISPQVEAGDVLLVTPSQLWTAGQLREKADRLWEASEATPVVLCEDAESTIVALQAFQGRAVEVTLLPADLRQARPAEGQGCAQREPIDTRWVLFTSGTTGEPKRIRHTQQSLTRTIRVSAQRGDFIWGLLYEASRMAGLQVIAQSLMTGARLVAPNLDASLAARLTFMAEHGVNALSATPTLWRRILQLPEGDLLHLDQITLGGEIADQRLLDALVKRFPGARVTHVFAATESGAAFAVSDGRAGFPLAFLEDSPDRIRMRTIDGVLHVHAPDVEGADRHGFVSTGDLVEVVDDRVIFLGRASGAVNVGGAKVMPEAVEEILRSHPEVREARVLSRSNPFSGSILVADVVVVEHASNDLAAQVRAWVRDRAPSHYVPAKVSIVDSLAVTGTGKTARA